MGDQHSKNAQVGMEQLGWAHWCDESCQISASPLPKPRQAEGAGKNQCGNSALTPREGCGVPQSPSHPATTTAHSLPPGKNQSACWMSGSMMPTICSETVVIISVMFLQGSRDGLSTPLQSSLIPSRILASGSPHHFPSIPLACSLSTWIPYPSACGQRRLGPSTMATLLGVILFMSWYSVSLARNLITYLEIGAQPCRCIRATSPPSPPKALLAPGSPDVVVVGFGQLLAGVPESLQPLLLLRDAAGRWVRNFSLIPVPDIPLPQTSASVEEARWCHLSWPSS